MDRLIRVALDACLVGAHRRKHLWRGFAGRSQQCLHKAPRLRGIQHDAFAGFERLQGGFARFSQHETADRLPGNGRRLADDRLVLGRNPRYQALPLLRLLLCLRVYQRNWHF